MSKYHVGQKCCAIISNQLVDVTILRVNLFTCTVVHKRDTYDDGVFHFSEQIVSRTLKNKIIEENLKS